MGLMNDLKAWISHPFETGQNAWKWVLFVGLVLVAAVFWQLVLIQIVRKVE